MTKVKFKPIPNLHEKLQSATSYSDVFSTAGIALKLLKLSKIQTKTISSRNKMQKICKSSYSSSDIKQKMQEK